MGFRYYDPNLGEWVETAADHAPTGMLGSPWTPASQLPRKVRNLAKRPLAETILMAQTVLGFAPVGDVRVVQGSRAPAEFTGTSTSLSNVNNGNIRFRQLVRSGSGAQAGFGRHWGAASFHHILDPSQGKAGWTPIFHDYIRVAFGSNPAFCAVGFVNANSVNDETSIVGAVWKCSQANGYWTSGLYDGTGTPSTTVHETAFSGLTTTTARRLSIVLDAASKSVLWYADYALVDSYTPSAVLSQMGAIPRLGYYGWAANGSADMVIQVVGGANPRLLTMKPAA